jgi:hypothetical protein
LDPGPGTCGDGVDARATPPKKPLIRPEATALADRLMKLQRLEPDDPRCIAAAYTVEAWLAKGWKAEIIEQTIHIVMSKLSEAPRALRYFEQAIARGHVEADRPLPVATEEETHGPDRSQAARPSRRSTAPTGAAAIMAVMGERAARIEERRRERMAAAVPALPPPS